MPDDRSNPSCAHCGDRVGVYERLWFDRGNGELVTSSLLKLRRDGFDPLRGSLWHLDCLPAERARATD